jgi:hypothetical protein
MKNLLLGSLLALSLGSSAHAENSIRRGYFISGVDKVTNNKLTTPVAVEVNPLNNSARLYVDRKPMEGRITDGVAAAYDTTPITYFYYEVILNPPMDREGNVIVSTSAEMNKNAQASGSLINYGDMKCPKDANALLVSYKGNGTSKKDCLYLSEAKEVSRF